MPGFQARGFQRGFQQGVATVTQMFWGLLLPRKKKKPATEEIEAALEFIQAEGTSAEQERAARIESEALFARIRRAERALTEAQRQRAEMERKWAISVAQRIARDREDEELALVALLID